MSKWTPKNHKNWHNTPEKKFESNKRQWITFRPQSWDVPYRNHLVRCEKLIPKLAPNGTIFYHDMLMPLHDTMPSFMNFRRVLDLLDFKNQVSQCFADNQQCPGVWNSLPFLAWDLSMHPRTHISFFNQFICTWECALESLDYESFDTCEPCLMGKMTKTPFSGTMHYKKYAILWPPLLVTERS